jgi:hypothetical protein
MGYRSEVAFCLKVKEPEKFVAVAKIDADDTLTEMLDNMYYYEDKEDKTKYILFTNNYWKWYDESERAFARLMELAENYDDDFACKFVRQGEHLDDAEEEAFGENGWSLSYPYIIRGVELGAKQEELNKIIKEEKHATTS